MTAAFIVLTVCLVVVIVVLLIFCYHQMLMLNEVNKRLLLLTQNSIEDRNAAMSDLTNEIQLKNEQVNNLVKEDEFGQKPFDPHTYSDNQEGF